MKLNLYEIIAELVSRGIAVENPINNRIISNRNGEIYISDNSSEYDVSNSIIKDSLDALLDKNISLDKFKECEEKLEIISDKITVFLDGKLVLITKYIKKNDKEYILSGLFDEYERKVANLEEVYIPNWIHNHIKLEILSKIHNKHTEIVKSQL